MERYQIGNKRYHSIQTVSLLVTAHLNLSEAFASICPSILLNKLQALRTSANALNWFQSYLTGREQITVVGISIPLRLIVFFLNFYLNFKVKYSFFLIKHKYLQNSISASYNTQYTKHYLRMFVTTREPREDFRSANSKERGRKMKLGSPKPQIFVNLEDKMSILIGNARNF